MNAEGPVLVVTPGSVRFRRFPYVFSVVLVPAGLAMAIQAGSVLFSVTMILLTPLFIVLALNMNRFGLFANGLAPPHKPLRGLLQEPYVIPWGGVLSIEVLSDERADPLSPPTEAIVKVAEGTEFVIRRELVAYYLGNPARVQQYFRLLAYMESRLRRGHYTLETSDILVQRVLSDQTD